MSDILPAEAWKERGDERGDDGQVGYTWESTGHSLLSYTVQWDRTTIGQTVGNGGLRLHRAFPWTAPRILHDTVG